MNVQMGAFFPIRDWAQAAEAIGGPNQWWTATERWAALGATHVTFYTSGQGIGGVEHQIEAMWQFRDAVR